MTVERLQKILARAGIASRRASEEIIQQGRVTVNGQVAALGMSADPDADDIRLDGERLRMPEAYDYIMLNKPRGVISDEDVSGEHDNARDLIPVSGHLYPVGRLDLDSEGLMLFTNDGELAHKLTHPRYEHPKTYRLLVEGSPSEAMLEEWRQGVWIEGKRTEPAEVKKIIKTRRGAILEVTLREGRKRQIRKVAAKLGFPVLSLVRTGLGPLTLGELPTGAWRRLNDDEVAMLRKVRETKARVRRSLPVRARPAPRRDTPRGERSRRSGERTDRSEGTRRQERPSGAGRPDRPDRPRRSEGTGRGEGFERPRRPARSGSQERSDRPDRARRSERMGPGDESEPRIRPPIAGSQERIDRAERPRRGRSTEQGEAPRRPRRPDRTGGEERTDRSDRPRRSPRPERAGGSDRSRRTSRPASSERPARSRRTDRDSTNRPARPGRSGERPKRKRGADRE